MTSSNNFVPDDFKFDMLKFSINNLLLRAVVLVYISHTA